jgi:hypothetical protein
MLAALKTLAIVVVIGLSGCAATVAQPTADARPLAAAATPSGVALLITGSATVLASTNWHTFRVEWRTAFASEAKAAGLSFTDLDAEGGEQPAGVVLVLVAVNKYRYLTPETRATFGIMTGNAFINADAEFFEFPGRRSLGRKTYSTSSLAWEGIFSAITDKQLIVISNAMIQEIKRK